MSDTWDVALMSAPSMGDDVRFQFPRAVAVALKRAGYTRALVRITDNGILITPYASDPKGSARTPLALPDWNGASE